MTPPAPPAPLTTTTTNPSNTEKVTKNGFFIILNGLQCLTRLQVLQDANQSFFTDTRPVHAQIK